MVFVGPYVIATRAGQNLCGLRHRVTVMRGVQAAAGRVAEALGPKPFTLLCLHTSFAVWLRKKKKKKSACPFWARPQKISSEKRPVRGETQSQKGAV